MWQRLMTAYELEVLDVQLEELRTLLILQLIGKTPGFNNVAKAVNRILTTANMPTEMWMKED